MFFTKNMRKKKWAGLWLSLFTAFLLTVIRPGAVSANIFDDIGGAITGGVSSIGDWIPGAANTFLDGVETGAAATARYTKNMTTDPIGTLSDTKDVLSSAGVTVICPPISQRPRPLMIQVLLLWTQRGYFLLSRSTDHAFLCMGTRGHFPCPQKNTIPVRAPPSEGRKTIQLL